MPDLDVTVIGGGIVGCAVAAEAAGRGWTTALLERATRLGTGCTARNSEVAHGGMYYPEGSLKARMCAPGRRLLRRICSEAGLPWRECGKLILAVTDDETAELARLHALGLANGVEDLRLVGRRELARLEPEVRAVAALLSPRTSVFAAEETARALGRLAVERGASILTSAEVVGLAREEGGWTVCVEPAAGAVGEAWRHTSRFVVNAAGLFSDRVARLAGCDVDALGWRLQWVKGNYFSVAPHHAGRVGRLLYPCPPSDGSLGIHVCVDVAGQLRLGPDMEPLGASPNGAPPAGGAVAREDYAVDAARRTGFLASAARYLSFLDESDLEPAWAGIRPRRRAAGFADFVVACEADERAGLVNLIGIDSPGLTSAPALARHVGDLLAEVA
jgi:L-2-hydroxyglutarate oxidase LhgO